MYIMGKVNNNSKQVITLTVYRKADITIISEAFDRSNIDGVTVAFDLIDKPVNQTKTGVIVNDKRKKS